MTICLKFIFEFYSVQWLSEQIIVLLEVNNPRPNAKPSKHFCCCSHRYNKENLFLLTSFEKLKNGFNAKFKSMAKLTHDGSPFNL